MHKTNIGKSTVTALVKLKSGVFQLILMNTLYILCFFVAKMLHSASLDFPTFFDLECPQMNYAEKVNLAVKLRLTFQTIYYSFES